MSVENTCHTCEGCGNRECHQLELRDIDADRLSCNAVVTDCHDCTSGTGIDQVQDDKQRQKHENDTDRERRCLRGSGNTLSTLDDDNTGVIHSKGSRILEGEVETALIHTDIDCI